MSAPKPASGALGKEELGCIDAYWRAANYLLAVDGDRNDAARPDTNIAAADSGAPVLVVEAREDLEMARQVRQLLDGAGP